MTGDKFVLVDTYALIELIEGNPAYSTYTDCQWGTTQHALIELFYYLLRTYGLESALKYHRLFKQRLHNLDDKVIAKAMVFRLENKKDKLSYTDCLGYALAQELNAPFLTGDIKFKGKVNVAFVQ